MYKLRKTKESEQDLENLVVYMMFSLNNEQAATSFLKQYQQQIQNPKSPKGQTKLGNCST